MAEPAAPFPEARSDRRRWIALVVVCLAMLMNAIDASIVNVALPAIQRGLHFSQAGLTWVGDAYMIAFGAFLLLAGRLGDLVGRKKVFLSGIAVFTLSSLVCAIAPNQATLVSARFAEGLGAAVSTSVIMAIIVTEFPLPSERARAMSCYLAVTVGGGALGLLAGGVLTQAVNWHWIFLINVPIGIVTVGMGWLLLDENVGLGLRQGVDVAGSLLVTVSLLVGTYGILKASDYGWGSSRTLASLGIAAILLCGFLLREMTAANPIMPLRIFRIRSLTVSSTVRCSLFGILTSVFFLGALYLERVGGYSPLKTGFAYLPISIAIFVCSMGLTARLLAKFGPMRLLVPGMIFATAGMSLTAIVGVHVAYPTLVLPAFLLLGLGAGTAGVPLLTLAMAEVPKSDAGLGSGITNVSIWLSSAIGLAVLGSIASSRTKSVAVAGHPTLQALTSGYRLAFLVGACITASGLLMVTQLRGPARRLAEAASAELGADVIDDRAAAL